MLWQIYHNLREGFFLGQELPLDFVASNAANLIMVYQLPSKFRTHFASLKRVYDASQPPGTRYFKPMLKILVDRTLMHHHFVRWYLTLKQGKARQHRSMVIPLMLDQFTCCVSRHNNQCKPAICCQISALMMLFFFDLQHS